MNKHYDVIVVGMGVAGLYAALNLPKNLNVLLITKKSAELSNSSLAQGGIAAVLDNENDTPLLHAKDTLIAGKYKNNKKAINVLVEEGPKDVLYLKKLGVDFDTDPDGNLLMTLEAGHSRNRIVHHKDFTGKAVTEILIDQVKKHSNIKIMEETLVYTIEKKDDLFLFGLLKDDKTMCVSSNYCILATGGIGRVYKYTTNSAIATGDGIMFAKDLGANIKNISWVQMHPTAFAAEANRERFLISEAVRGEGAVLLNCKGERFAFNYDKRAELAPRDVVSNAIMLESIKTSSENFYLDITHKSADFVKERFPMIYANCLQEGIDITKDRIPIFPCQHYLMGGIDVDLYAKTNIDGLYAAGECSHTGVHGANRLASNSLLEALVFSRRAAQHISSDGKKTTNNSNTTCSTTFGSIKLPKGIRTEIRSIIQESYFVIPRPELFDKSLKRLKEILDDLTNTAYELTSDYIEAKSLATVATLIMAEVANKEAKL